jgi:hypothetical protein
MKNKIKSDLEAFPLGIFAVDSATKLEGVLTMMSIESENNRAYLFQPSIISAKTKIPMKPYWVDESRIESTEADLEPLHPNLVKALPVLGTVVEDYVTDFTGVAVALQLHLSGCVHVDVQSDEFDEVTESLVPAQNFDIRRLTGDSIEETTAEEELESEVRHPSPVEYIPRRQ